MSISNKLMQILSCKSDIKSAIELKGISVGDASFDQYAGKILQIHDLITATEVEENDVNFYDYSGLRVASYSIEDAKSLTQSEYNAILPPVHEGLTFQEWNWTLEDIVNYNRKYIDIAANYIPIDGKTRVKISISSTDISIILRSSQSQTISIDWGDNSAYDSFTYNGSSLLDHTFNHSYSSIGEYVMKFTLNNTSNVSIVANDWSKNIIIKELNLATNTSANINYALAFRGNTFLLSTNKDSVITPIRGFMSSSCPIICVPRNVTHNISGYYPFQYLNGKVCFPATIGQKSSLGFISYTSGKRVIIPESTTATINSSIVEQNRYATIISLPASLSNVPSFSNCSSLKELDIVQGWIPAGDVTLNQSTQWTSDSIVSVFNKLGDRSSESTPLTLTFGSTNLAKLTQAQKDIATNKGYTLA